MHIIVTGANGYIAKNLLLSFNSKHKLTILSRKTNDIVLKKKNYLKFDLRKKIPNLSCDILIHAAGITPHGNYYSRF